MKTHVNSWGDEYENFKSQENFLSFLEDIEKNNTETLFQVLLTSAHGGLNHFVGIIFKNGEYRQMDSLSGTFRDLLKEEAKMLLSDIFNGAKRKVGSILFVKLKLGAKKVNPDETRDNVIKIIKE